MSKKERQDAKTQRRQADMSEFIAPLRPGDIALNESVVEQAALAWLEALGFTVAHGPDIAPGELAAEQDDYGQVVRHRRLRDALLPKLVSGEIRIKDAERIAGRCA